MYANLVEKIKLIHHSNEVFFQEKVKKIRHDKKEPIFPVIKTDYLKKSIQ